MSLMSSLLLLLLLALLVLMLPFRLQKAKLQSLNIRASQNYLVLVLDMMILTAKNRTRLLYSAAAVGVVELKPSSSPELPN